MNRPGFLEAPTFTGIFIAVTPGVEVYGNTLVNNPGGGIGAIQWDHGNVGAVS